MNKYLNALRANRFFILLSLCIVLPNLSAQETKKGVISGNFNLEMQSYQPDSIIGADTVAEKILSNSYMNVLYQKGAFTAGVRFEGYLNTMLGYDNAFDGFNIAHRYATYKNDLVEVTAGSYYDQFGNGTIFRTYEEKGLGYDNAMDGMRVIVTPHKGMVLKGIIGRQRLFWDVSQGLVRGVDGSFSINEIFQGLEKASNRISIGGSFVSKYQQDENPKYILPENVGAGAVRLNYSFKSFNLSSEYSLKGQDPSADNNYIYKQGQSLLANANFGMKGLGFMVQYKWLDNMSFRSDRDQQLNGALINYLPAISKNHTYSFTAMYPYATQLNGESGFQAEVFYKLKRKTFLGGKYGTLISLNYSQAYDIKREKISPEIIIGETGTDGYTSKLFSVGDEMFYRDINVEVTRKLSKKVKGLFTYQNVEYNQGVLEGHGDMVRANVFVLDVTTRLKKKQSVRTEVQWLDTKDDNGSWAMGLLEYTKAPHWFLAVSDQYNYGNSDTNQRIHYYQVSGGYKKESTRLQISYGKQREGILCVGGVCRAVPSAYGFNLSISTTF